MLSAGMLHASALAALDILNMVAKGGVIAIVIVALSIALLALCIMLFMNLRAAVQCPEELLEEVAARAAKGRLQAAEELLGRDPSALSPVLEAVIRQHRQGVARLDEPLAEATAEQSLIMQQRVGYVGLIGNIAPMLGLLGTVSGMISAFATMSASAGAPDTADLAGSISEALVTTYIGLVVAIPAQVAYTVLRHRVVGLSLRIGEMGEQLVDVLRGEAVGGPRPVRVTSPAAGTRPTAARRAPHQRGGP